MTREPVIHFSSLLDRAALEHLKSKTVLPSFSHYDVWLYEHAVGFTVAKMMNADLLQTTKSALEHAMQSGESYDKFVKKLKPYLMAQGWWGESVMTDPIDGVAKTVQLGSTRRLRVIFQTNLATAYAAGQWARVQEDKADFPYLKYIASTAEQKRQSHMTYYGKIWRVDDPIWQSIFPPNGYGCQCTVRQLNEKQALRERGEDIDRQPEKFTERQKANHAKGIIDDGTNDIQWVDFTNPRTGQTVKIPFDVMPTFAHNHAARLVDVQMLAEQRHGKGFIRELADNLMAYLKKKKQHLELTEGGVFASSANLINEGRLLYETHITVMNEAIKQGKPHEGIMEIMRREGIELGGEVYTYSSNAEAAQELTDNLQVFPTVWLQKSNEMGRVLVADSMGRAWHYFPDLSNKRFINMMKNKPQDFANGAEAFQWAFMGRKMAFQQGDSMMLNNLNHNATRMISTQIHEFTHRLQKVLPELNDYFVRLWHEKTANDKVQTLRKMTGNQRYRANEIGKRDDFPNPYYGKMYGDEDDPLPLEMMTMIFEALLGGDIKRYQELARKPDFLYFGLALLVRYQP
ncbi:phage head morphogenesis protein [Alysiella crassa]|uniref:Phage head morphogenesis protein, SPP1 gp7 family n=1 Tax=Alysiella crassa TaxID=153491 RepID=A0A376BWC3_9NEIS|nr:phage head morphogenesis protein [Alysiella crassa]UOP06172.1 phage head morphogenesis protein [Alysiella crassa]SSY80644.1 phage head morphogenesis protein, SPP1 gp7 family [Alysiella crassa]